MANTEILRRIADALERLAPPPAPSPPLDVPAYAWRSGGLQATAFAPLELDLLSGIDDQKSRLLENTRRHAAGHSAHDALLWGARGSGKSALVKATVGALQKDGSKIALVELGAGDLATLSVLFDMLAHWGRPVILFVDDLAFENGADAARALRSVLDGGSATRPTSVRLYVTSNRRHVVARDIAEQESAINPHDVVDDRLALADRFGLSIGFHVCDQDQYLAMVAGYAAKLGLGYDPADAIAFATQRGTRSGRVAWHYAVELAGRAERRLP